MIHTSLSPNTEVYDLWLAFKALFFPWNWLWWKRGSYLKRFPNSFKRYLGVKHAFPFQRGRDALYVLLYAFGICEGKEVILQAYTCIVVPNAIQYTGAKPVYVDIEKDSYNINTEHLESSISNKTKAVIIQHTFGEPANIKDIREICTKHKLLLIEDCAHSLSATYHGEKVGTFGDAAMWSFGRDKIISSIWGGMITTNDDYLAEKILEIHAKLPHPSLWQIIQSLLHPLVFALIKPIYNWKLGKAFLVITQKLRVIPRVIFPFEKKGRKPQFFPQKMPNALAKLAYYQFMKLNKFHKHRQSIAKYYNKKLKDIAALNLPKSDPKNDPAWLRYTIRTSGAANLLIAARKQGIYLGDWYRQVLAPEDCLIKYFQYKEGSCPQAEKAASETINLPTHIQIDKKKASKIIELLSS